MMMKIFLRAFRWVALMFAFLLVLGVTGLLFYTHTDGFRELVRQKLLAVDQRFCSSKSQCCKTRRLVWEV